MTPITYRPAHPSDREEITELLSRFALPTEDVHHHLDTFIVACDADKIVGCIGVECHGTHGLLRSLAVDDAHRNHGIGDQLCNRLTAFTSELGITNLHLLTTTAEEYFVRRGFVRTGRDAAPESIRQTREFSTLCPSDSAYMILHNPILQHS